MIDTTRDQGGNLKTTTGAMPSLGRGPVSTWLVDMINRRGAEAPAADQAVGAAKPRDPVYSSPQRMPNVGANGDLGDGRGTKKKEISRFIPDPWASPYHRMQYGQSPNTVKERYIEGVGWEFDGAVQGRGSGGGSGSIDTNSSPTGGYNSGSSSPGLDPRMAALTAQQEEAKRSFGKTPHLATVPSFPSVGRP